MSTGRRNIQAIGWGMLALGLCSEPSLQTATAAYAGETSRTSPDLHVLLSRTIAQVARDRQLEEQFKARYAFSRTRITETRDGNGTLKKRSEERFVNPPPPDRGSDSVSGEDEGEATVPEAKRPYARHDFKVDAGLLERFRFSYLGEELLEGRPVWVVDFEPASDRLPARSLKDRFINLTAGRLWIDQDEAALARAEFRLTGSINVAGGLVGALKHCAISMARKRTPEGFWYPALLTWQIEGRKFFSTRRMEHREETTDVKPLAVEDGTRAESVPEP